VHASGIAYVIKLFAVGNGDPLFFRLVVILRVEVSIFHRGESEFGGWRRSIINGELEVRISGWLRIGVEPE
jgi:hypothetical protein